MSEDVIVERLENLKKQHEESDKRINDKVDIVGKKLDFTNGKVKKLQIWKAYITGGIAVLTAIVIPLLFLIIRDKI